jgi:hypothetical protein
LLMFIKWSSLQKSVGKFRPKKFYEIDPWFVLGNYLLPWLMFVSNWGGGPGYLTG